MDFKYKQLEQELTALSKVFSDLGVRLAEVAKEVTGPGVMPSEKLLEQISASRTSFENTRSAIHGHAGAMLVSPLPKLGELVSIAAIDSLLKASAVAEETKFSVESERERALAILGRVLAITHRESSDFKALQECHAKVGELRNGISNVLWPHRHPESEAIISSKHPTTALLHFVENLDKLDDDSWMVLETTITDTYGKPLFVAASRGKLAAGPANKSAPAAPPPAKAPAPEPAKPVEKKIVAEKTPEKPVVAPEAPTAPVAPVSATPAKPMVPPAAPAATEKVQQKPAAPTPVAPAASAVTPEKKQTSPVVPVATASLPVAPVPAAAVPAAPPVVVAPVAPAPVASVPPPAAPVTMTQQAAPQPRPPAPAPVAPPSAPAVAAPVAVAPSSVMAAVPAAPAAVSNGTPAGSALTVTMTSLSALASATEPAEKKPAAAPVDSADRQRKEARLAAPPTQAASKPEPKPQELPETAQQGVAADGSQRPQRWGFWRGNR